MGKKQTAKCSMQNKSKIKSHPPLSEMINEAIKTLKDRNGTSLLNIKKYIKVTYKIDVEEQNHLILKYLKLAVNNQTLVQVKSNGNDTGLFKLPTKIDKKNTKKDAKPNDNKAPAKKISKKKTQDTGPDQSTAKKSKRAKKSIKSTEVKRSPEKSNNKGLKLRKNAVKRKI